MLASVVALQLALGACKMQFPKKGFHDQTGGISWCPAEPALFTCPPTCQYDCRAAGCGPECCSYWPVQNSSSGGRLHHRLLASCPAVPPQTLVLLGIFSMPTLTKAIRRRLFRESILPERGTDTYSVAHAFVLGTGHGRMSDAEPQAVIQQESDAHGDLLLLDLPENMNRGKTLEFFVAAAHCWAGAGVAWIAKTDDDAYVHLPNLQHALSPFRNVVDGQFGVNLIGDAHRINLSCGPQPWKGRETEFCGTCVTNGVYSVDAHGASFCKFGGGLYGFTGDVVRWISASADAFRSTQGHALYHGYEDAVSARWMKLGRRGRNAFALGAGRLQGNVSARSQSPYTVLVHKLKKDEDLLRVKEVFSRLEASPRPRAACVGRSVGRHPWCRSPVSIITGTGRAGTSFLIGLLSLLHLPTGFTPAQVNATLFGSQAHAGLEVELPRLVNNSIECSTRRIYKQPKMFGNTYWLKANNIGFIIIPFRDSEDAAASRQEQMRNNPKRGGFTGGAHSVSEQRAINDHTTATFFWKVSKLLQTRIILLSYPEHALSGPYAFAKLKPFLDEFNVTEAEFLTSHAALSQRKFVDHI